MKKAARRWLAALESRIHKILSPPADPIPDLRQQNAFLTRKLAELSESQVMREAESTYMNMVGELVEARQMAGAGPWTISPETARRTDAILASAAESRGNPAKFRESLQLNEGFESAQGAFGDIELALQNIEWRREINISWMEFSRWGIQQIMLICRLYYIKNPIVRRLIDVCAAYVFARGVEITTSDETANDEIKDFLKRNKSVFGQTALVESEKRKDYDGNLFWCCFADKVSSGKMNVRLIDATEIQEIVTDPEDRDTPWYYFRVWTQKVFDPATGVSAATTQQRWYPALGYKPAVQLDSINGNAVAWDSPVYHRKCGAVGSWLFGCPRAFPMMDWARESRRMLEACASLKQSLMQIGLMWKTKGGQQALEGLKQQLGTTVGPNSNLWDSNPVGPAGKQVAMGTGTSVEAFKTNGAGGNPDDVRQYKLMCCMVAGVPETFLADVSTGNLATATSLDRPTETIFLEKQEAWREDLITIISYMLEVSAGAASGALRETAGAGRKLRIQECSRKRGPLGEVVYEAFKEEKDTIEIQVNFPAIREGDIPALVDATVKSLTLDNKGGQIIGIDAKAGMNRLYDLNGIENGQELTESQFPEKTYDPDRTKEPLPPPIPKGQLPPGGAPQIDPQTGLPTNPPPIEEALRRLHEATREPVKRNGRVRV